MRRRHESQTPLVGKQEGRPSCKRVTFPQSPAVFPVGTRPFREWLRENTLVKLKPKVVLVAAMCFLQSCPLYLLPLCIWLFRRSCSWWFFVSFFSWKKYFTRCISWSHEAYCRTMFSANGTFLSGNFTCAGLRVYCLLWNLFWLRALYPQPK